MLPGQPTYSQQWQKITSAYVNNELRPYDSCACFLGNLLGGNRAWASIRDGAPWKGMGFLEPTYEYYNEAKLFIKEESCSLYAPSDIVMLENNFLGIIYNKIDSPPHELVKQFGMGCITRRHPNYESALYEAMVSTLEMLRQIHLSHDDETAIEIPLTKRQLVA